MPKDVADDAALARAAEATRKAAAGLVVTAEAPVAWPSGAFVRVDRLDEEARAGIERSAEFAARVGSPVLTIHLFIPLSPTSSEPPAPSMRTPSRSSSASTRTRAFSGAWIR